MLELVRLHIFEGLQVNESRHLKVSDLEEELRSARNDHQLNRVLI
jgi:hypothetical protein